MSLQQSARSELAVWLRLVLTPGIGPASARDLLAAFGLPDAILGADHAAVAAVVGAGRARALLAPASNVRDAVARTLDWADADDNRLLTLCDREYPPRLLQIGDPPPVLYVRGAPARLSTPALAIVGSRSATRTGLDTAQQYAKAIAGAGFTVVSGLALGIDAAAHRGALATPAGTVAVLGTGIDRIYPSANASLADAIVLDGGCIVSEVPLGAETLPANFPRRNRIIAGLSIGVLVVEAALRSGSLITARLAAEFGREVFAMPGSIHSALSRGCHALIKQGAKLVESADDILDELPSYPLTRVPPTAPQTAPKTRSADPPDGPPAVAVTDAERGAASPDTALLAAIGWDPIGAEALALRWRADHPDHPGGDLSARLLALELAGEVERLADGRYRRRPVLS